jgi:hypothetical protein
MKVRYITLQHNKVIDMLMALRMFICHDVATPLGMVWISASHISDDLALQFSNIILFAYKPPLNLSHAHVNLGRQVKRLPNVLEIPESSFGSFWFKGQYSYSTNYCKAVFIKL